MSAAFVESFITAIICCTLVITMSYFGTLLAMKHSGVITHEQFTQIVNRWCFVLGIMTVIILILAGLGMSN